MKIKDIVRFHSETTMPIPDVVYHLYSLPSFDNNQTREELLGQDIQSNKFTVPNRCILFNKLNVRFKRIWRIDSDEDHKIASTEFLPLIIDENKVDFAYCFYLLASPAITDYLCGQNANTSGSHKRIDPTNFFNIGIKLPPLAQQYEIGKLLSSLDAKIKLNRQINQNLETMIADVMDYKFLSNVEKLPKRRIGDIALIKAGGDCPQEWSKYKTKDYQIPIYSNGTDNEGLYGYTKESVILKRSVTVAARGTIGYCEIREGGYVPIIRLLAVTPNDIGGDVYLHQVFNRIKFKNDGSIQQQLTVPSIASIEIPYPDASALKTFANITYPFIEKIKLNKIQIEELTKQRDKLLPLLMNGQVSVNSDLSVYKKRRGKVPSLILNDVSDIQVLHRQSIIVLVKDSSIDEL